MADRSLLGRSMLAAMVLIVAFPAWGWAAGREPVWVNRYEDPAGNSFAGAVATDPRTGNVYVTGNSCDQCGADDDYVTVAYSAAGEELWQARYNGAGDGLDQATALAVDSVTGTVYVTGSSDNDVVDGSEAATVAYSSTGEELWVARYAGSGSARAKAIAVDSGNGRIYVAAGTSGLADNDLDFVTLAYNRSGGRLWAALYNGPEDGYDDAVDVAVDSGSGNVFVTGFSSGGPANDNDYATVGYNASGERLWVARFNGSASEYDAPVAIATDPAVGNVYVTGTSNGGPGVFGQADYATVAYSATGRRLWVARYDGPGDDDDEPADLAADSRTGNIYVTGTSESTDPLDSGYATLAYSVNGTRLWTKRYDSPAGKDDIAAGVAVDHVTGNVFVTGSADQAVATVSYGPTGSTLRVVRFGYRTPYNLAAGLAVDPVRGRVYVLFTADGPGGPAAPLGYTTLAYSTR